MTKYTFYGVSARAQVEIIDLTGGDTPPALRKDRVSIYAYVLPSTAHKNVSFSTIGQLVYSGQNLDECLSIVKSKLSLDFIEVPNKFKSYLNENFQQ